MALLATLAVAMGAAQTSAQHTAAGCDSDRNGFVSTEEATACADRGYTTLRGADETVTRERFSEAFPDTENIDEMWTEADTNQDGVLAQEE
jgi:hypothetical protein